METRQQIQKSKREPRFDWRLSPQDIQKHPQVAYAGWAYKARHRPRLFVGYSKKPVPGPDGKDCYIAVMMARQKSSNGRRTRVPLRVACFSSRERAFRASLLSQAGLLGLKVPTDGNGLAVLSREELKSLRKKVKALGRPASLCTYSPFPSPKKDEKKAARATANEALEQTPTEPAQVPDLLGIVEAYQPQPEQEEAHNPAPDTSLVGVDQGTASGRWKAKLSYGVRILARFLAYLLRALLLGSRSDTMHAPRTTR